MPAKPLTDEQQEDAARLREIFASYKDRDPSMTQEKLAHVCGWKTQGTITQYLNGKIPLNLRAAQKFAEALDTQISAFSPSLGREVARFADGLAPSGRENNQALALHRSASPGMIDIPLYDARASMGVGHLQLDHDNIVERMTISAEWLRSSVKFTQSDNLGLITAYGDSMEGTFSDGDVLLVDRGVSDIKIDAVYALSLNDELYIKRLQRRPDGAILMISDNKKYDPYVITNGDLDKFQVMGRVLLAWNARKL